MLSLYLLIPTLILSVVVLGIGGGIFCLIGGEDQHHNTYLYGGSTLLHRPWRGPPRHKLVMWTIYGVQTKRERKVLARGNKIEDAEV